MPTKLTYLNKIGHNIASKNEVEVRLGWYKLPEDASIFSYCGDNMSGGFLRAVDKEAKRFSSAVERLAARIRACIERNKNKYTRFAVRTMSIYPDHYAVVVGVKKLSKKTKST